MRHHRLNGYVGILLLFLSISADRASADLHFKELAGPPAEIKEIRTPDPKSTAVITDSALQRVELQKTLDGRMEWQSSVWVQGDTLRFLLMQGPDSGPAWNVFLVDTRSNEKLRAESLGTRRSAGEKELLGSDIDAEEFEFHGMHSGAWIVSVESLSPGQGFLVTKDDLPLTLLSHVNTFEHRVGTQIDFSASVLVSGLPIKHPRPQTLKAILSAETPARKIISLVMHDDGLNGDEQADDGVFKGGFVADVEGAYAVQIAVSGEDEEGRPFVRTAQHLVYCVCPASIRNTA